MVLSTELLMWIGHHKEIWKLNNKGLTLGTSASESLCGGQFTLSTQLIKPNILPTDAAPQFFVALKLLSFKVKKARYMAFFFFYLFDCISETFIPQIQDFKQVWWPVHFSIKRNGYGDLNVLDCVEDMGNTYQERKVQHRKGTALAGQQ